MRTYWLRWEQAVLAAQAMSRWTGARYQVRRVIHPAGHWKVSPSEAVEPCS